MKAIIIGAGIGGLSTAIALRNAGVEVVIYEQASVIREVGAGLSLWPNATKALEKLGLGAALKQISVPQADGGIHDWHGKIISAASTEFIEREFGAPVIIAHRAELLAMLTEAAQGIPMHLGTRLKQYKQDGTSITAIFENGQRETADLLIGADGIKSVVRNQMLGSLHPPRYAGYTAWRAIAKFDYSSNADYWGESWGRGARFGLAPVSNGRVYWFAVLNAPENTPTPPEGDKAYLLNQFGNWHHPIADLINATHESVILHNDIYDVEPLTRWTDGRVALLGDSAHAMTPNLGQGACQALEDAVALGSAIQSTSDVGLALANYQTKRMARANVIVNQSRRIGQVGQLSNPIACWLRDNLFRNLPTGMRNQQIANVVGHEI
ncbi:MAG: FAD-dependent monooxygenase [Anaerolineae bacterium]|nr:FAD-dependent monooxygenase [Anaerolineae bacterium]